MKSFLGCKARPIHSSYAGYLLGIYNLYLLPPPVVTDIDSVLLVVT